MPLDRAAGRHLSKPSGIAQEKDPLCCLKRSLGLAILWWRGRDYTCRRKGIGPASHARKSAREALQESQRGPSAVRGR
jgi:hypothetical protein